jgi:hypothetical protein
MKKKIEITVPTDYSAINLKKYIQIQNDLEQYKDNEDAMTAFLLYNFCGITPEIAINLDANTINGITNDLKELMGKTDYELQKQITIDGVEYGIEPNLSELPYGAYLDISSFENISLDYNWANICEILYRPIKKKRGVLYELEPYKGYSKKSAKKWLDVNMDFHFSVFFYFLGLYQDLVKGILNSMKNHPEISPNIKSILAKSGELIQLLQDSQTKTLQDLMK